MRRFRVREHRFETDPKAANLVVITGLGSFAYVRDGIDISWLKRAAIVFEYKTCFRKRELRLDCAGIFGVLQQLIDKMRTIRIEVFDDPSDTCVLFQHPRQVFSFTANFVNYAHFSSSTINTPNATASAITSACPGAIFNSSARRS